MAKFKKAFSATAEANVVTWGYPFSINRLLFKHTNTNWWWNADFNTAQNFVKINEGGYQDIDTDPGNWTGGKVGVGSLIGTNYGISAPTLKAWLGREPSVSDMQNLTYDTALQIYKKNYWDALNLDNINNQDIANVLYDGSVNEGVGGIKKIAADSLGTSYSPTAVNQYPDQQALFNAIKSGRAAFYDKMGGSFLNSWLNRLKNFTWTGVQQAEAIAGRHKSFIVNAVMGILLASGVFTIIYSVRNLKA